MYLESNVTSCLVTGAATCNAKLITRFRQEESCYFLIQGYAITFIMTLVLLGPLINCSAGMCPQWLLVVVGTNHLLGGLVHLILDYKS